MKKTIIIIAFALLAACSSDPIKEKLPRTVTADGYEFVSYEVIDTMTFQKFADLLILEYCPSPFMTREEFASERDELAESIALQESIDAMLGYGAELSESRTTRAREAVQLMDELLGRYDSLGYYSQEYQHAVKKMWVAFGDLLDLDVSEHMKAMILLEFEMAADDFAEIGQLLRTPDETCILVSHQYLANAPFELSQGTVEKKEHVAVVSFDTGHNVLYTRLTR